MNKGLQVLGLCLMSVCAWSQESERYEAIVKIELTAAGGEARTGRTQAQSDWIVVPKQCEYVSHDVEVLKRVPQSPPEAANDGRTSYADGVRRDDAGRVTHVSLQVIALQAAESGPLPVIVARLSMVVRCDQGVLKELRERNSRATVVASK